MVLTYLLTKNKYLGSVILSVGLMLIYIKIDIFNKVDINNLLIITKEFSKVLRSVINNLGSIIITIGIISILLGIFLIINNSFVKKNNENNY